MVSESYPKEVCSYCGGSGWERSDTGDTVRRCRCGDTSRADRLLEEARIPKRYQDCDIESYKPTTPKQRKAKMDVNKFLEKYPHVDVGLLFLGSCGVGKTHLAVAVLKSIIVEKGDSGLFYDFRDLLRDIQGSWNSVSQSSELQILRPVLEAKLLVLDELGANKPTEWVRDTIAHIINCRYNDKKLTIFTSNFLDTPAKQGDEPLSDRTGIRFESLSERIGVRLRSRLYEMCKVIEIDGKDFRLEVRQASYIF
jgi:DNA replication protein DnaC